jgi:putative aminopeptidase FrvX
MNKGMLAILLELLQQPTAPFREQHVIEFATRILRRHRVPHFIDPIGNVVVGCASRREYAQRLNARSPEPVRLYIAHMDHPGFHGVRWLSPTRLQVRWYGGAPTKYLVGAPVWIAGGDDKVYHGHMRAARLTPRGGTIQTAEVTFANRDERPGGLPTRLYGGFGFRAPVWRAGALLYTKAADDLVGVFAILDTAIDCSRRGKRENFIGLLTRAEEVGFIGAIGHLQLGWLQKAKRPVICISLETSRTLPNAVIGKGPVVRLGDRRTVFDPGALNVLTQLAARLLPHRHQRRVMDGGTCEATAATVFGLPAIGLSIPLGNYHNQGFEGGPDCRGKNGPAPEFVHLDDVAGALALCRGLLQPKLPWDAAWRLEKRQSQKRFRSYAALLKTSGKHLF